MALLKRLKTWNWLRNTTVTLTSASAMILSSVWLILTENTNNLMALSERKTGRAHYLLPSELQRRSVLGFHWKDWCWSWNSNTLATSCEELTHWKRLWCWQGLEAGGEGDDRGWDGWMASPTRWTWVCVISGRWWWRGRRWLSDWAELNCKSVESP